MNRRNFIKNIGLGLLALTVGNIVKPEKVDAFVVDKSSIPKWKFHKNYYLQSASEKLYQARLEAKRTGKTQIVAQQKRNINKLFGKYS